MLTETDLTGIETERLLLRPLREADRQAVVDIQTDPRTNRFEPVTPGVPETLDLFDTWLEHWAGHSFGYLAATVRGGPDDDVLGICGVRYREFRGERMLNLAYRFRPSAWGKGYAGEGARAVVGWAERTLPSVPVLISVTVANKPSLRVAERLGFTNYLEENVEGDLTRHYRR